MLSSPCQAILAISDITSLITHPGWTLRKILDDKEFQEKNKTMDMPVDFDGPAAFEKYLANYKKNAQAFFKEQGMTK